MSLRTALIRPRISQPEALPPERRTGGTEHPAVPPQGATLGSAAHSHARGFTGLEAVSAPLHLRALDCVFCIITFWTPSWLWPLQYSTAASGTVWLRAALLKTGWMMISLVLLKSCLVRNNNKLFPLHLFWNNSWLYGPSSFGSFSKLMIYLTSPCTKPPSSFPPFFVFLLVLHTIFDEKCILGHSFYTAILIFSILLSISFPWALAQLVN